MKTTTTATEKKNTTAPATENVATAPVKAPAITGKIKGAGYTVQTVTIKELADMLEHLPPVQSVRGSVWPEDTAAALVNAVKAGMYVPPVVLGGKDKLGLQDGQQRARALVAAYRAGVLDGASTILVAVDVVRTAEECFKALNLGVPVSKSLTAAMSYPADVKAAVLSIADMPLLADANWTKTQTTKTARAAAAASAVAIWAGWASPESSETKTNAWLLDNAAAITHETLDKCKEGMERLQAAAMRYYHGLKDKPEGLTVKACRNVCNVIRRRGTWLSIVGAVAAGLDPVEVLGVIGERRDLLDVAVTIPNPDRKGATLSMSWADTLGAGSSGGTKEYAERVDIMRELVKVYHANPDEPKEDPNQGMGKAEQEAKDDTVTAAAADLLAAAMGG